MVFNLKQENMSKERPKLRMKESLGNLDDANT